MRSRSASAFPGSVFGRGGVAGASLGRPRVAADTASTAQGTSAIKWVGNETQSMV